MHEPRFAEEVAARRAARLARMKRRRPYQLKPDLPGMTKRDRRFGYWRRHGSARFERVRLLATGALRARKRPARPPPSPRRELKPRPPPVTSNKRLYSRQHEHARGTFGRDGIGLLRQFYDLYVGWTYR